MRISFYKKLLLVCLSFLFIHAIVAQDTIKPFQARCIIKLYPSQMMIGHNPLTSEWGVFGEVSFSRHTSTELAFTSFYGNILSQPNSPIFQPDPLIPDSLSPVKLSTWGRCIRGGVRFYLNKKQDQMQGFYLAPVGAVSFVNKTNKPDKNITIRMIYASLGLNLGYQIILPRGFCFDFNVGLAARYGIAQIKVNNEKAIADGFAPKVNIGLGLGYCFK